MGDPVTPLDIGEFRIEEVRVRPAIAVLAVHGEVDLHTAPALRERLTSAIEAGRSRIVLDLSEVTFLDSMALGVLLGGMRRLRDRGGELRLVVAQPEIKRIFEITLLDRVFVLDATLEGALAAPGAGGAGTG
jgi:anti-sigma B factor antagonist